MKAVELQRCARVAVEKCGHVQPRERVLMETVTIAESED